MIAYDSLQRDSLFVVLDGQGHIDANSLSYSGLYYWDTRVLKTLRFHLRHHDELTLSSKQIKHDKLSYSYRIGSHSGLSLHREVTLESRILKEHLAFENYSERPFSEEFYLEVEADFQDLFEVRGALEPWEREVERTLQGRHLSFHWQGLDGIRRELRLSTSLDFRLSSEDHLSLIFPVSMGVNERWELALEAEVEFVPQRASKIIELFRQERKELQRLPWRLLPGDPELIPLVEQARRDLESLTFHLKRGLIPAAGRPWFVAIFGRDSLITALEVLPYLPELARGVLTILGDFQAEEDDPTRDAEPGKILHELRIGERAQLGPIPNPYYGSVDATPLFIILFRAYLQETGDWALLEAMQGRLQAALRWIRRKLYEGDGFIYFQRRAVRGLENQGWKDSSEAICYQDGRVVHGQPVALVEAQGYAYAALKAGADLLSRLGDDEQARNLYREAEALKHRFNEAFWMEDEGYFASALVGANGLDQVDRVDSITSNPGHGLLTGIIAMDKIEPVVHRLLSPELLSGYGVRTLSTECAAYDPLSYHNGSVWPHDNALIMMGLQKLGFSAEARRIARGLFEAARHFNWQLPELFGGFNKDKTEGPIPYPDACWPQAWAAGAALVIARVLAG